MEKQNVHVFWRSKTCTRFGGEKHARVLEKKNMHALWRTTENGFSAWLGK